MTAAPPPLLTGDPLEDAAAWRSHLFGGDAADGDWHAFTLWLEADDAHRLAFDQIERLDAALDEAAEAIRQHHLAPHFPPAAAGAGTRPALRWSMLGAAGIALACALPWIIARHASPPGVAVQFQEYRTATSENRDIKLPEGTTISLRPGSVLHVSLAAGDRVIGLVEGDAFFQVATDRARALVVNAGGLTIRDIGTAFDVRRAAGETTVIVARGLVSVTRSAQAGAPAISLAAGDRLIDPDGAGAKIDHADPATAAQWTSGFISYDNAPLAKVVEDLNQFFGRKIVIRDPDVSTMPFSGVLKLDDEDAVVRSLTKLLPVAVDRASDGTLTLRSVAPHH